MNTIKDFKPCRACKKSSVGDGYILNEEGLVEECFCHKKWKHDEELKLRLNDANIPTSIMEKDFDTYKGESSKKELEKLKVFVHQFKEIGHKKCLYMYGSHGTQKTTLAHIVAKHILDKNKSVFYIRTMDLIVKHFSNFNPTEEDEDFMFRANESDLVIIDESFARKRQTSVSDYQLVALRNYLKDRIENREKALILISNYGIGEIVKQGFDKGLADLIARNTLGGKVLELQDNYSVLSHDFDIDELFQ